ncbi:hypothetical protein HJC23_001817 [Cyclotella cryptica]|uniref:RNA helicase n=1 Tax=Cyclotella cryptica TaxID=29204 RepID=A0ABD3PH32_9STRA|eukprot:CCRYP_014522-RA/>CCRYP_014522-RA protein AED:0.01 eAED:0.01 QI:198/1/1/1/1/1/2/84/837
MMESLVPLLLMINFPTSKAWVSRTTQLMPVASTIVTTSNILTEPTSKLCLYAHSKRHIVEGSKNSFYTRQRIFMSTANDLDDISFDTMDVVEHVGKRDEISLDNLTVPELRERLREQGLKVSGTKSELRQRILEAQTQRNNSRSQNDDAKSNGKDIVDANNNVDKSYESELQQLPHPILEAFMKYTTSDGARQPKLLPIQQMSYQHISNGGDAVLFSPTGTGKTLAYILPLAARLFGWKRDGSLVNRKQSQKKRSFDRSKNDSLSSKQVDPATPSILVIEPSRELARQVGKVWTRFHPTAKSSSKHVATVYGGVPMARHAALLNSKTDVVVGTPGRIRELIREKYLSTENIKSIVLDEADTLLNFKDVPEVEWLLDGMMNDYQLILASATINKRVKSFVGEIMEIEVGREGYFVIDSSEFPDNVGVHSYSADGGSAEIEISENSYIESKMHSEIDPPAETTVDINSRESATSSPVVRHWSIAASMSSRIALASDLIVTMSPRRGIIFASSKAEVEKVALELSERLTANDVSIHILHGDMIQAARSRAVASFRGAIPVSNEPQQLSDFDSSKQTQPQVTRILVATDVASRGLDLPAVDLVLQFGVPRKAGKDGTFGFELYIHRTGRAGRFGSTRDADAILLYDRSLGEGTTLSKLQDDIKRVKGVDILPRALPSAREVMDASYERAYRRCSEFEDVKTKDLVQYFRHRLLKDGISDLETDNDKLTFLLERLACAMAALSGLPEAVHPRSLLTADPRDRTVRVWTESGGSLTPPEVTNLVKSLGSGKLGRISICEDGSAVFDLSSKKAERLLETAQKDEACQRAGWHFELPGSLPSIPA